MYTVDANIAIKWAFDENFSPLAVQIAQEAVVAPDFILIETANVVWKKSRKNEIDIKRANQSLLDMRNVYSYLVSTNHVYHQAFHIGIQLNHSIYDCIYLATALHTHHPLVTADHSFFDKVHKSEYANSVIWIEDFKPMMT